MNLTPLHDLTTTWRDEADQLRRRGAEVCAKALESAADDLDETLDEWWSEALTLAEAAEESGYHVDTLQHKVADGDLPNAGEKGAPRIRRCDLPRKPELGGPKPMEGDLADKALRAELG